MLSYSNVQKDKKSIYAREAVANPGARRGLVSEAARVPLTKPHISPLTHSFAIKLDNSSVKYPLKTACNLADNRLFDNQRVNLVPVYIPQFKGSVEIWSGASLVIVKRPPLHKLRIGADRLGGGLRGSVSGFSDASQLRMRKTLGKIKNDCIPVLVTLTYPLEFPHESKTWKRHLDTFFKRLRRQFTDSSALWKLEPQKRGAPHFHMFIWGAAYAALLAWVNLAWYEVANTGDEKHLKHGAKIEHIRSWRGVQSYAAKYMGKLQSAEEKESAWLYPGRWWGVYGRERIPWGKPVVTELSRGQSIRLIRVMRKYQEKRSDKFKRVVRRVNGHFDTLSMLSNDATNWLNHLNQLIC